MREDMCGYVRIYQNMQRMICKDMQSSYLQKNSATKPLSGKKASSSPTSASILLIIVYMYIEI